MGFGTENIALFSDLLSSLGDITLRIFDSMGKAWTWFIGLFDSSQPNTDETTERAISVKNVIIGIGYIVGKLAGWIVEGMAKIRDFVAFMYDKVIGLYGKFKEFFVYVMGKAGAIKDSIKDLMPDIPDINIKGKIKSIMPDKLMQMMGIEPDKKSSDTKINNSNAWNPKRITSNDKVSFEFEPIKIENNNDNITVQKSLPLQRQTRVSNKGNL